MTLLIDSHVVLWWLEDNPTLGKAARELIASMPSGVFVSAASLWELEIKIEKGLLTSAVSLKGHILEQGFEPLPITFDHAETAARLPPIHRDPFDRMIVAQAMIEGLTVITRDPNIPKYGVAAMLA